MCQWYSLNNDDCIVFNCNSYFLAQFAGDIIVTTFPKCGTTWTEQVILLLLNNGDGEKLNSATKNTYIPNTNKAGKIWLEPALEQKDLSVSGVYLFSCLCHAMCCDA